MHLFHYHLVTSKVRPLEGRYLGKLGFELIGRYGWRGESSQWFEPGISFPGRSGARVENIFAVTGGGGVELREAVPR